MTQISILGCGWLGLPLAKAILENEFSVKGSTTSREKPIDSFFLPKNFRSCKIQEFSPS